MGTHGTTMDQWTTGMGPTMAYHHNSKWRSRWLRWLQWKKSPEETNCDVKLMIIDVKWVKWVSVFDVVGEFSVKVFHSTKAAVGSVGWLFPLAEFGRGAAVQVEKTQPVQPLLEAHLALLNRFSPARSIKILQVWLSLTPWKPCLSPWFAQNLRIFTVFLETFQRFAIHFIESSIPPSFNFAFSPCRVSRAKELLLPIVF